MPSDVEFFQKIKDKTLESTTLPKGDYSKCNFDGVYLSGCNFTSDSIFCKDKEVFQKIKEKKLSHTRLPKCDYSDYNFNGVNLTYAEFTVDSVFSCDKDAFQRIRYGILGESSFPDGDYRTCDFKYMRMDDCRFTKNTLLPEYEDFLQDIRFTNEWVFPYSVLRNIHNYNLDGLDINLDKEEYKGVLTHGQLDILKFKYPERIGIYIILPEEVCGEESYDTCRNYNF